MKNTKRGRIDIKDFIAELSYWMQQGYSYTLSVSKMNFASYGTALDYNKSEKEEIEKVTRFYNKYRRNTALDKELPKYENEPR